MCRIYTPVAVLVSGEMSEVLGAVKSFDEEDMSLFIKVGDFSIRILDKLDFSHFAKMFGTC